jgi:hypothetical protein
MSGTVWDQEFFRRRAAGEQEPGRAQEPTAATPLAPGHATIAELLLARAGDDNTALLFEDQRWSWRELVQEAVTRSALMQQLADRESCLEENLPQDSPAGQAGMRLGRARKGQAHGDTRAESSGRQLGEDRAESGGPVMRAG